ncbi:hypothetical protein R3W88_017325 [Solanum pinnatisectum]|uniref:TMEM205-like domain-containing protein n=1 Tax=Solanum pinnatisectum TaxID=50273 RepID=A0AAV9KZY2_9SOLN|nr:hypothetical protein R3W88_017325 [Solanum pinnatisectum]
MNIFAIFLVLTTLITAGIVSPNERNIKISISPQETEQNAKTEYVSDRIASALEGTKHSVSEKIEEDVKGIFDKVAGKSHEASEKVKKCVGIIVDKVNGKAKNVSDTADTLKGDVEGNATEDVDLIENAVIEDAHRLKVEGKRSYQKIRRFFSHMSAYIFSSNTFRSFMGMIHLLGFALSYGVCFWVTFISSKVLAKALPKQQFSVVQSKIYPVYFKTLSYGVATAFLGHYLSQSCPYYASRGETIQGLIFLAIFSMTMFNSFYLEPQASKLMRERMKLEKEEGKDEFDIEPSTRNVDAVRNQTGTKTGKTTSDEPLETQQELSEGAKRERPQVKILSQMLKKLNLMSSFLNVLTLIGLTSHLLHRCQLVHSSG